jgi:indolepyruvate ferredoxin oxidoreductase
VTQDAGGLAQKGGATCSHVLIGATQGDIRTTRVSMAAADLIIACDPIVAANKETALRMREGRTHVALNSHAAPTAAFVTHANWANPAQACISAVVKAVGLGAVGAFNADAAATHLMGDSIYTNPMMLGFAWQKGWIPLEKSSLLRAIELNAVAVENNKTAFEWGRRAAHDGAAFDKRLNPGQVVTFTKRTSLDELIAQRVAFLTGYQNAAYAQTYQAFVQKVKAVDESAGNKGLALTEAVARYLFKLMAYKDEYEVARLHTDAAFYAKINALFEGDFKLHYHLAPPLLAKKNSQGELQKQQFGPGMLTVFKLLARLKGLRGTALDVFSYSEERRQERALITAYRASIEEILLELGRTCTPEQQQARYQQALAVARIPEQIRGYGHVKARSLTAARQNWQDQLARFRHPQADPKAA